MRQQSDKLRAMSHVRVATAWHVCRLPLAGCRLPTASCRRLTDRQTVEEAEGAGRLSREGGGHGKLIAANYKQQPQAMPQDAAAAARISADHTCCAA